MDQSMPYLEIDLGNQGKALSSDMPYFRRNMSLGRFPCRALPLIPRGAKSPDGLSNRKKMAKPRFGQKDAEPLGKGMKNSYLYPSGRNFGIAGPWTVRGTSGIMLFRSK